jgi:CheY-like chemotaxis protein
MVVRACSALLLKKIEQDALRRDIVQIDDAAKRGGELTKQLLAFSKQQVMRPALTDVNDVVRETLELLNKVIGEDVEVVLNLEPTLPAVLVDRGQLGQVVVNLAVNARDAMPRGGSLTISTSVSSVDGATAARRAPVKPGPYVLLQITDTGVGMDEETSARAFDPFFTTKETGTGLGLPSVHGIVAQSGGHISLYSEEGMGTTARVALPVAAGEAVPQPPTPPAQSLSGDETILLVEDDEVVRMLVGEALRGYGYTVVEASKGDEALELSRSHAGTIDLLLTDVVMPGMSGAELADLLSAERAGLALIFTSGYPANTVVQMGAAYLQKPYDPAELAAAVRSALAGRGA